MNIAPAISRIVNNPKVIKFASNPTWPVAGLIITNAAFRPIFTLADPNVKPQAKKYSAAREFFHQVLCLGAHFSLAGLFKNIGFSVGKKLMPATGGFENFKNYKEVTKYIDKGGNLIKQFPKVNGSIIFGSTLGAILALAVIAPKVNNILLPPILNVLGIKLDKEEEYKKVPGVYAKSLNDSNLPRNITASQLKSMNISA